MTVVYREHFRRGITAFMDGTSKQIAGEMYTLSEYPKQNSFIAGWDFAERMADYESVVKQMKALADLADQE